MINKYVRVINTDYNYLTVNDVLLDTLNLDKSQLAGKGCRPDQVITYSENHNVYQAINHADYYGAFHQYDGVIVYAIKNIFDNKMYVIQSCGIESIKKLNGLDIQEVLLRYKLQNL